MRNGIYELAFEDHPDHSAEDTSYFPRFKAPSLLTRKHIYAEALQIFFAHTRFTFETKTALMHWLVNIGPQNRPVVKKIDLRLSSSNTYRSLKRWDTDSLSEAMEKEIGELMGILRKKGVELRTGMLRIRCLGRSGNGGERMFWLEGREDGREVLVEE